MYKTKDPDTGGLLAILAGLLSGIQGLAYILNSTPISERLWKYLPEVGEPLICGSICVILGLASICGGILSSMRRSWDLALLGAILGALGFGFMIGCLFGSVAVWLIARSKDEFS